MIIKKGKKPCCRCGKKFQARKGRLFFCSVKCAHEENEEFRQQYGNECLECGRDLDKKNPQYAYFCSMRCAADWADDEAHIHWLDMEKEMQGIEAKNE